jgi:putative nucleotidyltransferase with HDIG domain
VILESKFLRSRVAKRVFTLFVACALVPMTVLTTLSFLQVSRQLRSQNERQLQQAVKSFGLSIFERLAILNSDLQVAALRVQRGGQPTALDGGAHFREIRVIRDSVDQPSSIDFTYGLTSEEKVHLVSGKPLVLLKPCSADRMAKCVVMARLIDGENPKSGLISGELNSDYLWTPERLPADIDLYVFDSRQNTLFRSTPNAALAFAMPSSRAASGFFEWRDGKNTFDASYRDLFLKAEFSTEPWTVVVSQSRETSYAPMQRFRNTLVLVALLAMWIVILFSLIQIRRTMGPLEKLNEGTKQIAEQNFDARVEIGSKDEFEDLAASFNSMSSQLGQQFRAMEELNEGMLKALARAIDAKSTWTAGHSERVTQVAVRIGRAMGLSAHDLQIMHRGGLLHDVGKIGTAPAVLDKPGKLDANETQLMRDHVRIGVRILEPIPAFAEALPIVAQHHEWFNGKGYPEGLAGEEISLYARIFAVADCYDAMVSDRPYRKGMPKRQVVEMLREKSGIQFDPNVIDVFVRLCAEDGMIEALTEDAELVEVTR